MIETATKQVPAIQVISRRLRLTIPQIPTLSRPAVVSLMNALKRAGVEAAGDMLYIYYGCDGNPQTEFDLEICLPIPMGRAVQVDAPIERKTLAPFSCVATDYVGAMSGIGPAWMKLVQWIRASQNAPTIESREVYKKWVGPESADNITELQQGIE